MRPYLILSLRWAITLALVYGMIDNGNTYAALALIYVMVWIEALVHMSRLSIELSISQQELIELLYAQIQRSA